MMITTVFSVAIGAFATALAGTPLVYHLCAWKAKAAHYQDAAAKNNNKYVGALDERDRLLDKLRAMQDVRTKLEGRIADFMRELTAARKLLDDCHAQRMRLQEENEHLRKELALYRAENDNINREIRNILNYDGTSRGQERLNG